MLLVVFKKIQSAVIKFLILTVLLITFLTPILDAKNIAIVSNFCVNNISSSEFNIAHIYPSDLSSNTNILFPFKKIEFISVPTSGLKNGAICGSFCRNSFGSFFGNSFGNSCGNSFANSCGNSDFVTPFGSGGQYSFCKDFYKLSDFGWKNWSFDVEDDFYRNSCGNSFVNSCGNSCGNSFGNSFGNSDFVTPFVNGMRGGMGSGLESGEIWRGGKIGGLESGIGSGKIGGLESGIESGKIGGMGSGMGSGEIGGLEGGLEGGDIWRGGKIGGMGSGEIGGGGYMKNPKGKTLTQKFFSHNFLFNSVPWIATGLILRKHRHNYSNVRKDFTCNFSNSADDYIQYTPFAITTILKLIGYEGRNSLLRYTTTSATSFAIMGLLVNSVKYSADELRPDGSARNSFPSGHTAMAFTAATIMHKEYGKTRSPWFSVAGYALAATTGCMRVLNNRHWVSDVFAGAGVGILSAEFGYVINDILYKEKGLIRNNLGDELNLTANPSFCGVSVGAGLQHQSLSLPVEDLGLEYIFEEEIPTTEFHFANRTFVGIEGAYFLNQNIGIGGRLRASARRLEHWNNFVEQPLLNTDIFLSMAGDFIQDYKLQLNSDHLSEFSTDLGLYFNLPISNKVSLGSKLLAGIDCMHGLKITANANGIKSDVKASYVTVDDKQEFVYEIHTPSPTDSPLYKPQKYETTWDYLSLGGDKSLNLGTGISITYAYKSFQSWRLFVDFDYHRKKYKLKYSPMEFIKKGAKSLTFNNKFVNPNDYIRSYVSTQRKNLFDIAFGVAFTVFF